MLNLTLAKVSTYSVLFFQVHELARAQMLKAGARQKRKYDHNAKQYHYNVGDLVNINKYKEGFKMHPNICRQCVCGGGGSI